MRLEALTAGIGAKPGAFSGTVHSVFARAFNLELKTGKLLGFVARDVGAVPRGFQLATPDKFSFLDHIRAGEKVSCRAGLLRIAQSQLSVDLRPATPWRGNLGKNPIDRDRAGVADAWRTAWVAVAKNSGAVPFARLAGDAIPTLLRAARAGNHEPAFSAVDRLIGLGDGLTPAGDDFLVGFMAGLWCMKAQGEIRAALAAHIAATANRTSAISRHYLEAAAEGEVSQPLVELAAAIGQGDIKKTAGAVATALAVGASSGAVASYGLLLATATE
jgi:hypothetical protein